VDDRTGTKRRFCNKRKMKVTITYKQISEDLQKVKTEKICKIVANALKRNKSENNKDHVGMSSLYYGKERILN